MAGDEGSKGIVPDSRPYGSCSLRPGDIVCQRMIVHTAPPWDEGKRLPYTALEGCPQQM